MKKEINSVVQTMIISLLIVWGFGSRDFAINITACWILFILLELVNKKLTNKTISQKFWAWKQDQPLWKVILVSLSIGYVGIYFALHLGLKI